MSVSICTGAGASSSGEAEGETLEVTKINNDDLLSFERAVMAAGEHPEVVLEACYGWYWATDLFEELGCNVHLAHPLGNNWGNRRVKNDTRDAEDLADLLRLGRLAEAWIAPTEVRELRELVSYGPSSSACGPASIYKSTPCWPKRV